MVGGCSRQWVKSGVNEVMKVCQVSPGVFDLEAETPAEQGFVEYLYFWMLDDRRVPSEFVKKQPAQGQAGCSTIAGLRFDARPSSDLKRNSVCKAFSFIGEKARLFWRELTSDC